jgi:hypothetical protein
MCRNGSQSPLNLNKKIIFSIFFLSDMNGLMVDKCCFIFRDTYMVHLNSYIYIFKSTIRSV